MGVRHVLLTKNVQVTESEAHENPGAEQSEKNQFLQGPEQVP